MKGRMKYNVLVLVALLFGGHSAMAQSGPNQGNNFAGQVKSSYLDLNKAQLEQLINIKGLGKSKAQAILDYRTKVGKFKTVEELKGVKGIGPKLFAHLKAKVKV